MSDNEIRKILIEEKKKELRYEQTRNIIEGAACFISLIGMCFMLALIG